MMLYLTADIVDPRCALDDEDIMQGEDDHQRLVHQERVPSLWHVSRMPKCSEPNDLLRNGNGDSSGRGHPSQCIHCAAPITLRLH